jgi:uncharacterized protein YecA (UPF0149 family)
METSVSELANKSQAKAPEVESKLTAHEHVHGPDCVHDHDAPAQTPIRREGAKVGRNDPCTCGSGKKFKKCCA